MAKGLQSSITGAAAAQRKSIARNEAQGVTFLDKPGITVKGRVSGYEYKHWTPYHIPLIQASTGIWQPDTGLVGMTQDMIAGRLPYDRVIEPLSSYTFQIQTPRDHAYLFIDLKLTATKLLDGIECGRCVEGSRFESYLPTPSGTAVVTTATVIGGGASFVTVSPHGLLNGTSVNFQPDQSTPPDALPAGLVRGKNYFVVNSSGVGFQIALTIGGAPLASDSPLFPITGNGAALFLAATRALWGKSLVPADADIVTSLIAISPAGRPVWGGIQNSTGFVNADATVSAQPHMERVPLGVTQSARSGRGSLRSYILFPTHGWLRVEVENQHPSIPYRVNGCASGYIVME
jgi:hypothetical protein